MRASMRSTSALVAEDAAVRVARLLHAEVSPATRVGDGPTR